MGCLRVMQFQEWAFGTDVRSAYAVVRDLDRREGVREFPTAWHMQHSLEFYRRMYRDETIAPFYFSEPPPSGQQVYVLPYETFRDFINKEELTIAYRGKFSDLVIAVKKREPAEK